jgi:O-antigen/teichoic acid export membrane protein
MKNFTYRTLAYLSDYAHADLVYLAKGGFWLTLSQVLTYVGSFALAIVFARNIPAETYGNYTYVLSLFGFFTLFSLPGIDTAVVQSVARGYEGSYYLGFWTKFKWSLVGSAALIAIGGYYFWVGEILLSIALVCGAILTPLTNASELYLSFLGGRKKFATQTKYKAIVQLTSYGSMIAALFLTKNLAILVLVYLLGSVLSNFYLYLRVLRRHKPNLSV